MPQIHARNAKLVLWDNAGGSQLVSGDSNDIVFNWTRKNSVVTTFGNDTEQRIAGLKDVTLKVSAVWNTGAGKVDNVLNGILSGSLISLINFVPASITGCVLYSACMVLSDYNVKSNVKEATLADFTLEMASGSVTVGTAV